MESRGLGCIPPNPDVEAITLSKTVFGDGAFRECGFQGHDREGQMKL